MEKKQLEWLIDALVFSQSTFKMVFFGGLVLSTEKGCSPNYVNGYENERNYLLERIAEVKIKNVFFLTGDKHFSELSKITNDNGYNIYDFSAFPLTASVSTRKVINYNQVEGSLIQERNLGVSEFSGLPKKRKLTIRVYGSSGQELWNKQFHAQPPD